MSDLDTGPRVFYSHHSCIFLCLCCWLKSRRSSWLKGTKPLSNTWLGSVLPATKPCLWAQTDFQLWISRGERHRFPQWHSHFSIWLITSNVLFAVRIIYLIYDSGSRRRPSTSWSSFWTMTQSPWMCRYVLTLVCPSRISSAPPVQLFIRVNIRDGSSCSVTQTLQCSYHRGGAQLDKSPVTWAWLSHNLYKVIKPHLYSYLFSRAYFKF